MSISIVPQDAFSVFLRACREVFEEGEKEEYVLSQRTYGKGIVHMIERSGRQEKGGNTCRGYGVYVYGARGRAMNIK